jgi:flavin reductase (DIM6/NTAB) family NADH-FMN oxidoreductase RutF
MTAVPTEAFLEAMAELPAGVTVITTTDAGGEPAGATLSAVSSLSLDPPLVLACFAETSDTLTALEATPGFAMHILAEGQDDLAHAFASDREDKFTGVSWQQGAGGIPLLAGCACVVECRVEDALPRGDHVVVIGAVERVSLDASRTPLIYHRRQLLVSPATRGSTAARS